VILAGDVFGGAGRFILKLTPVDWLLLFIAIVIVWRQLGLVWLRFTRLDPTEVTELDDGSADGTVPTKSMTVLLRDRLGASGLLPPPAVPALSMEQGLISVVQASPLAQAKFIGGLLSFIWEWSHPRTGHRVTGTVWMADENPKHRVTMTVSNTGTGASVAIHTLRAESLDGAVEAAADWAFQAIQADSLPNVPLWRQWTSPEAAALGRYRDGEYYEKRGELTQAMREYEAAADLEPDNAIVRLRRANVLERRARWIDAMEAYLAVIRFWPELRLPRYRLSSIYTVANLPQLWARVAATRRRELLALIVAVEPGCPDVPAERSRLGQWFLERSDHQLTALLEGSGSSARRGVKRVNPFGQWLRRFPARDPEGVGWLFEKAVAVAQAATRLDLDLAKLPPSELWTDTLRRRRELADQRSRELEKRLSSRRNLGWKVHYNAACFYSSAMALAVDSLSDGWVDRKAAAALAHLERMSQDPDVVRLEIDWLLRGDPDLEVLRAHPAFKAWASFYVSGRSGGPSRR